jgi:epoxide hydrolase-like predicted phosphatase
MAIRAVIFDLGGVLFRIHDPTTHRQWEARLGLGEGQLAEIIFTNPVAQRATVGDATAEETWEEVRQRLSLRADELKALRAEFWKGGAWDRKLLAWIRSLRADYKTGLVSDAWPDTREEVKAYVNSTVFDVIVISAEERVRKPDPEIYQRALARLGVAPEEAVFVDDRLLNVEGARRVGMHVVHFTDPLEAREELQRLLQA